MKNTIQWLLESEPWVEYGTRLDLLGQSKTHPDVIKARNKVSVHPQIKGLLSDLSHWNEEIVNNHNNAALPLHKLSFIADAGIGIYTPGAGEIVNLVMAHHDTNEVYQVIMNIPRHSGGTGKNTWGWMMCDAPIILYSLVKLGIDSNTTIDGINFLVSHIKENGWTCDVSREFGNFRGPGSKDDPCPYATLLMLKLLSQIQDYKNGRECRTGAEALLRLWEKSLESHPYSFYMGTDFRKLKAPTFWYDIVSVTDVLSQFDWLRDDPRLKEMIDIIKSKADTNGCYTPESEYKAWNGWDFGQKKKPSAWLTFIILRILKRMETIPS